MGNPLLVFWTRLFDGDDRPERRILRRRVPMASATQASATIFLVLRRMRAPLIVLIVIFSVSTLGLTLIPGQDPHGAPLAHGVLRRLLRDELHGVDDRLRRDPLPLHLQPAHVGDDLDLPHRRRVGVRDRVAAGARPGAQLPQRAGAPALLPQGPRGCASPSCSSSATGGPGSCSPGRSTRWAAGSSSSTRTRRASTTSTSTPTTPTCPGSSPTRGTRVSWASPVSPTLSATGYSRSPTTTRPTSRPPRPRRSCGRTCR